MGFKRTLNWISSGRFLYDQKLAITLWFGLSLVAVLIDNYFHSVNNYIIYKQVFWHIIHHQNLYLEYSKEYVDVNLYGPLFSIVIAPFALLPDWLGAILWVMFNTYILYFAISQLPISKNYKGAILILGSNEMMNNAGWLQSNALIAACIILAFVYTRKNNAMLALLFILLGTFIKIYGIVGLSFFFFSKGKWKYILWFILWSGIFFILPAVLSGITFLLQSYKDWVEALAYKAAKNIRMDIQNDFQDISVMGMIRRIFKWPEFKDLFILVPAMLLFAGQYLQYRYFKDLRFQLYLLCSVLLFTVIFSTGSESPTYIIAFPAVCLWYVLQPRSKAVTAFFVFALLLTSFSYSDIFTEYVRTKIVRPYSLKALPCFIAWLIIVYQVYTSQFLKVKLNPLDAK
jgi:hypothetical protein